MPNARDTEIELVDFFETDSRDCALPLGWTVGVFKTGHQVNSGELVLALVNSEYILGHWYPQIAGVDWLVLPLTYKVIYSEPDCPIEIVGIAAPSLCSGIFGARGLAMDDLGAPYGEEDDNDDDYDPLSDPLIRRQVLIEEAARGLGYRVLYATYVEEVGDFRLGIRGADGAPGFSRRFPMEVLGPDIDLTLEQVQKIIKAELERPDI